MSKERSKQQARIPTCDFCKKAAKYESVKTVEPGPFAILYHLDGKAIGLINLPCSKRVAYAFWSVKVERSSRRIFRGSHNRFFPAALAFFHRSFAASEIAFLAAALIFRPEPPLLFILAHLRF